ncbi:MAG: DNA/RNA non-specific endonuclease [Comamonas sp.]|nr:DNA/RNA non-specific endonuclease [Comamonas sp.]
MLNNPSGCPFRQTFFRPHDKGSGYSHGTCWRYVYSGRQSSVVLVGEHVPQDPRHNGGPWFKIEQDIRRDKDNVFVITGPLFDGSKDSIGANQVRVPRRFFKLVYDPSTSKSWAYVQRNAADERISPPMDYESFQRTPGLTFLK